MGLLQKLKSALGLGASGSPSAGTGTRQDGDVTIEREPSTASEDAVKGTETDTSEALDDEPPAEAGTEGTTDGVVSTDEAETTDDESTDETESTDAPDPEPAIGSDAPVTEIKGVGPAYAERLEDAGVSTVSELAVADADELAEATELSPNRIAGWIEQAESF